MMIPVSPHFDVTVDPLLASLRDQNSSELVIAGGSCLQRSLGLPARSNVSREPAMPTPTWLSASSVIRAAVLRWGTAGKLSVEMVCTWRFAGKLRASVPQAYFERGIILLVIGTRAHAEN